MRRTLLAGVLVLVMVLLIGCGTAVPDIKGMTVVQAQDALRAAGFTLGRVKYDEKAQGAAGAVVVQKPAAGKRARSGSPVVLTVAGFPPVPTPDLSGLDKAKAEAALAAAGLVMGTVTESYDASVSAGIVASQTPAPLAEAPEGSAVTLIMSKGPEPVGIPAVKGKTQVDATKLLEAAGFKVKAVEKSDSAKKGTVIAQSPSGVKAQPLTTVTITVSTGVELVKVPDLVHAATFDNYGADMNAHLKSITGPLGLRFSVSWGSYGSSPYQRPRAGEIVAKGTLIKVVLVGGE